MYRSDNEKCWHFWKCSASIKKACPAYNLKAGDDCCLVKGMLPNKKRKFEFCWSCSWYKKRNKILEAED